MNDESQWLKEQVGAARRQIPEAWDPLFKRYQTTLYCYCTELMSDRTEALDAVQDTFVRAIKNIHTLRDDERFASWLFSIARQRCWDRLRKKMRAPITEFEPKLELPAQLLSPDESALANERASLAVELIARLDPDLSETLTLFYLNEFSLKNIAEICGVPEGTVKSRLHRGRRILATQMEQAHEPTR